MAKRKTSTAAKKDKDTVQPELEDGLHKRKEFTEHQTLFCDMTDDEVLAVSRMASDLKIEIDNSTTAMKNAMKSSKEDIAVLQNRFDDFMEKIDTGQEYRDVKVLVTHDYEDGLYIVVREDTQEEITRRPLRENERQQDIPGMTSDDSGDGDSSDNDPKANGSGDSSGDESSDSIL